MDITDVKIVRITELTAGVASNDLYLAADSESFLDGYPVKIGLPALVAWVISVIWTNDIYTAKGLQLRDGEPYQITFPTTRTEDYVIVPSFVRSGTMTGLTISNEDGDGFQITAEGDDAVIDILVVRVTPLT